MHYLWHSWSIPKSGTIHGNLGMLYQELSFDVGMMVEIKTLLHTHYNVLLNR